MSKLNENYPHYDDFIFDLEEAWKEEFGEDISNSVTDWESFWAEGFDIQEVIDGEKIDRSN